MWWMFRLHQSSLYWLNGNGLLIKHMGVLHSGWGNSELKNQTLSGLSKRWDAEFERLGVIQMPMSFD